MALVRLIKELDSRFINAWNLDERDFKVGNIYWIPKKEPTLAYVGRHDFHIIINDNQYQANFPADNFEMISKENLNFRGAKKKTVADIIDELKSYQVFISQPTISQELICSIEREIARVQPNRCYRNNS